MTQAQTFDVGQLEHYRILPEIYYAQTLKKLGLLDLKDLHTDSFLTL